MSLFERLQISDRHSLVRHENHQNSDWLYMHAASSFQAKPPCFSVNLLNDLKKKQRTIRQRLASNIDNKAPIHHLVLASDSNVFNLGGDLALFHQLIKQGDRDQLLDYAKLCIEVAYNFSCLYQDRVHSIAVIQGDALGGGFEAALCCHTIIAERGTGMGFPEVLFDLFPGMGAYTFLTRRVPASKAERMMLDAKIYSADELFEMGIVDILVEKGEGIQAANDLIKRHGRISNAMRSLNTVRNACAPISLEQLLSITSEWVYAAMRLNDRGLRNMERLINAQSKRNLGQ
jgi:DSF synthase